MSTCALPAAPKAAVLLCLAAACFTACGPKTSRGLTELARQRALWESLGIVTYQLEFQRLCYCPPEVTYPYLVEVEKGAIVAVQHVGTGEALDPADWDRVRTVDEMFDLLEDASGGGADKVTVTYHPQLAYPTEIDIDYIEMAIDDEVSYRLHVVTSE